MPSQTRRPAPKEQPTKEVTKPPASQQQPAPKGKTFSANPSQQESHVSVDPEMLGPEQGFLGNYERTMMA